MNNALVFIIGLFFITCPFYIFDSGIPQPAHYVALVGFVLLPFVKNSKTLFKKKVVLYLLGFVLLVAFVNTAYFIYFFNEDGFRSSFLLHAAYYVYNFGFFLVVLQVLDSDNFVPTSNKLVLFLLGSLAIQLILAILGINKVTQYVVTGRSVLFFNNPNQLGYYTLLLLTLFTVLPSTFKANKWIVIAVIAASVSLSVYSSSRIVLVGVCLLTVLLLYQMGIKTTYWLAIALIGVLVTAVMYQTEFIQKKIELIEIRNHRQDTTGVSEWQIRGYDRIQLHPEYLVYGAGEGKYNRFSSFQKGELHSGFGTVLFSYGVLGLVVFLVFFFKVVSGSLFYNMLVLSPVILYNVVHQGFRNPLFWILLAAIFIVNKRAKLG